jgi:hypothetical protein
MSDPYVMKNKYQGKKIEMRIRPVFESPEVPDLIERIRTDTALFFVEPSSNGNYLELKCVDHDRGTNFVFYMTYTNLLNRCVGHEVEYENGYIVFEDFDLVMSIDKTDYVIPEVSEECECPVCYESYLPVYVSLCGHSTCNSCMMNMDSKGLLQCPICRSDAFKYPIALACNRNYISV